MKRCCTCNQNKPREEYWACAGAEDGKQPRCKECQRAGKKTPAYKKKQSEYSRIYNQIPEVKASRKVHKQTEEYKQKQRDYVKRPHVRARIQERERTPERQERRRNYRLEPENHMRTLEYRATFQEKYMLCAARKRAKETGAPFSLTEDDVHIPVVCPVLRIPIKRGKGSWTNNSPSLDKIVPELGYVRGNIAVISHRANTLKRNGTALEHRKISEWISKHDPREPMPSPDSDHVPGKTEKFLVYEATKRAKRKGIVCTIRPENILVPDLCPILGISLFPGKGKSHDGSPSLDRVCPDEGYTLENTRVISLRANLLKRDGTAEEHMKIADWMDKMLGVSEKAA